MLTVQPITLREARVFVTRVHRHHKAPQGGLFAVAASEGDVVRAVVIVGRPDPECLGAEPQGMEGGARRFHDSDRPKGEEMTDCDNAWHRLNAQYLPPDRSEPCPDCKVTEVYWGHMGHGDTNEGYEDDLRNAYEAGREMGWKEGLSEACVVVADLVDDRAVAILVVEDLIGLKKEAGRKAGRTADPAEDDCVVKCARLREVHEVLEDLVRAIEDGFVWPTYDRARALLGEIKKGEGKTMSTARPGIDSSDLELGSEPRDGSDQKR